jgi:para-nitrobenzyl esterase
MIPLRALGSILATALLVACSLGGASSPAPPEKSQPAPHTRRTLDSGDVLGSEGTYGGDEWRGIPYARSTAGELRWRAPQPPEPWSGVREALADGSPCPQLASPFGGRSLEEGTVLGSEECLFLNVFAPRFERGAVPTGDARLPVMVWIHGGGNTIGEAGFYDGGNLAVKGNVIVVAVNYRLGLFGWLRHAALAGPGASADDRSGNFGTLDLVRALEWVQQNAAAFGGDPRRVTIFGESAGGGNVFSLIASPRAAGLFHRAIVQSGGTWTHSTAQAERLADDGGHAASSAELAIKLMLADGSAADTAAAHARLASLAPADLATYLRGKSQAELLAAVDSRFAGMYDATDLIRDGHVLPTDEIHARLEHKGGYNAVPIVLGTNRDESKLFMFGDPKLVRRWFWLFPARRDPERYERSAEYQSLLWKVRGADMPATAMRRTQGPSVFVYRFDWDEEPSSIFADLPALIGAAHAVEIPFVFGHFQFGRLGNAMFTEENLAAREALSEAMVSYWSEFAYTGDPGSGRHGDLPRWTPWNDASADADKFIVLDTQADGGLRMAKGSLTRDALLARLEQDERFASHDSRCVVFGDVARFGDEPTQQAYSRTCSDVAARGD